jgi:hypothetical protein
MYQECLTLKLLCPSLVATIYPSRDVFNCSCVFMAQSDLCWSHVFIWVFLLFCGFGTFPKHSLFIPSIWQFSFNATQFAILEDGSCLLCFTFLGRGSDTRRPFSRWENNQGALGKQGFLPLASVAFPHDEDLKAGFNNEESSLCSLIIYATSASQHLCQ